MDAFKGIKISTTEMHTGGEPLRIVESGYPEINGKTILEKRQFARDNLDHLRKFLMYEPRGHYDMYGALLVKPDIKEADFAVLFIHNEGYSTMCGHAVIALGRYAVDRGLVSATSDPEIQVNIQCPCGLVRAFVEQASGIVRFHSVPAFAFALDVDVNVEGYGKLKVDIGYGGAFYAILPATLMRLDVKSSSTAALVAAASAVTEAVKRAVKLTHPENEDLAFLYGTILTDGRDDFQSEPTANICVFADKEVDRSPTGSGVTARVAIQHAKKKILTDQKRSFQGPSGAIFTGMAVKSLVYGDFQAVVVEVSGKAHYSGQATFTFEEDDDLKNGFLLR